MLRKFLHQYKVYILYATMGCAMLIALSVSVTEDMFLDLSSWLHLTAIVGGVVGMKWLGLQSDANISPKNYALLASVVVGCVALRGIWYFRFSHAVLVVCLSLLVLYVLWGFDGRYFALLALLFLRHVPRYLIGGQEALAEQWSIYVYYALVCSVIVSLCGSE